MGSRDVQHLCNSVCKLEINQRREVAVVDSNSDCDSRRGASTSPLTSLMGLGL